MSPILIPPLFYSLFTILSFAASAIGLPLTRPTYLTISLISIITAIIVAKNVPKNARSRTPADTAGSRGRIFGIFLATMTPCLLMFFLLYRGLGNYLTPPHNGDAGNHFFMIDRILSTHTLDTKKVFSGLIAPTWYPLGFQNFIAAILTLIGTHDLLKYVYPLVWIVVAFYPLSIYYFALRVTRNHLTALIASFVGLTFFMFPFNVFSWGGWSQIIGLTLMWFALGELYRLNQIGRIAKEFQQRAQPDARHRGWQPSTLFETIERFGPILILLNAIFLTHTTEIFSFLVLSIPLLFINLRSMIYHLRSGIWLVIINVILLIPLFLQGLHRVTAAPVDPILIKHYSLTLMFQMLQDFQLTTTGNWFFSLLFVLGLVYLYRCRRHIPILISVALIAAMFVLVVTTPLLDWLYRPLFPWLESERVFYLLSGYYSLVISQLLVAALEICGAQPDARRHGWQPSTAKFLTRNYLKIGLLLGVAFMAYFPLSRTIGNLQYFLSAYSAATPADLRLLARNRDRCPTYLNEPVGDASRFIPYLTGNQLVFNGPYQLLPDYQDRLKLLTYVSSESATNPAPQIHFDCLYAGAYIVNATTPVLHLPYLLSNPHLNVLDHELGSYIFTVNASLPTPGVKAAINPGVKIDAADEVALNNYFVGDLSGLESTPDGIIYRAVGQNLDLVTQLPLKSFTLTGQAVYDNEPTCQVTVNGQFLQSLTFPTKVADVTIKNLNLSGHQSTIHLSCPTEPTFIFTQITLN